MPTDDPKRGLITDVSAELGNIFRHLFPGILLMAGARISFPDWFVAIANPSWPQVFLLGAVALAIGNALFALNRYLVHPIVDYTFWLLCHRGPARSGKSPYETAVADHTRAAYGEGVKQAAIREHVRFRASAVFLLWTIAEVLGLVGGFHSSTSVAARAGPLLFIGSAVVFVAGLFQISVLRRIDYDSVHGSSSATH